MAATATGIHHRSYTSELRLRATRSEYFRLALLAVVLLVVPFALGNYWLSIVNTIFIAVIGAVGLNILGHFPPLPKTIDFTIDYLRPGLPRDAYARARVNRSGPRRSPTPIPRADDLGRRSTAAARGRRC